MVQAGRKNECKITNVYFYNICASISKIGHNIMASGHINEAVQKVNNHKIKVKAYSAKYTFTRN